MTPFEHRSASLEEQNAKRAKNLDITRPSESH
jgi:hypothetical protein